MKGKQFERLARKYMLPQLPGFGLRKHLLFAEPVGYLLRGFAFETSGFDPTAFTVWTFVQPLYVPDAFLGISYTFGGRLGSLGGGPDRWWQMDEGNEDRIMAEVLAQLQGEGLPFLSRLGAAWDLAEDGYRVTGARNDVRVVEAVAYSWAVAGDHTRSIRELDRLHAMARTLDLRIPWIREMDEHAQRVRALLVRDPPEATALLDGWAQQAREALRLVSNGKSAGR